MRNQHDRVHCRCSSVSQNTTSAWDLSADYPNQDGSFFLGNTVPVTGAHARTPPGAGVILVRKAYDVDTVPAHMAQTRVAPIQETRTWPAPTPPTRGGHCRDRRPRGDYPTAARGYKACSGWKNVVITSARRHGRHNHQGGDGEQPDRDTSPLLDHRFGYANVNVTNKTTVAVPEGTRGRHGGTASADRHSSGSQSNAAGRSTNVKGRGVFLALPRNGTRIARYCAMFKARRFAPVVSVSCAVTRATGWNQTKTPSKGEACTGFSARSGDRGSQPVRTKHSKQNSRRQREAARDLGI